MITIIDSGIGGLSVLKEIVRILPDAPVLYFGDTAFMPYGSRPPLQLYHRLINIISQFEDQSDLVVIACNAATVSLIDDYRENFNVPFVGVEPGIKPAVCKSRTGHIAVLATPRTLQSPQISRLIQNFGKGKNFHLVSCDNLAEAIERRPEEIDALLKKYLEKIPAEVDTIALACTHYPLIIDRMRTKFDRNMEIIDVSPAIAARVANIYNHLPAHTPAVHNGIQFECSGDRALFLERIRALAPELIAHQAS